MKCKHCGSKNIVKAGFNHFGSTSQRYLCKTCNRTFLEDKNPKKDQED